MREAVWIRGVGPALLVSLVACARTQQAAPPAEPSEAAIDARRKAAHRDLVCPDTLPDITPARAQDAIKAVALAGQTAYGLSNAGRLWIWNGDEPARVVHKARYVALARDGSESPDSLCTRVLAASGDGSLVVLGGRQHALTVRRAPPGRPPASLGRALARAALDVAERLEWERSCAWQLWRW